MSATPDEAIEFALKNNVQGISIGLARNLQAERNELRTRLALADKVVEASAYFRQAETLANDGSCPPQEGLKRERDRRRAKDNLFDALALLSAGKVWKPCLPGCVFSGPHEGLCMTKKGAI